MEAAGAAAENHAAPPQSGPVEDSSFFFCKLCYYKVEYPGSKTDPQAHVVRPRVLAKQRPELSLDPRASPTHSRNTVTSCRSFTESKYRKRLALQYCFSTSGIITASFPDRTWGGRHGRGEIITQRRTDESVRVCLASALTVIYKSVQPRSGCHVSPMHKYITNTDSSLFFYIF